MATPQQEGHIMELEVKDGLTKRQEIVLRFIIKCVKEQGYPPALTEIAKILKIKTPSGANRHVEALARKGYIEKQKGIHRGIRPKKGVEDLLEGINQRRLFEEIQKGVAR